MSKSLRFVRFADIDRAYINRDYQIHTQWTDGQHTAREIIDAALQMGLSSIAFTEHIRRESTYFPDFFAEINALRCDKPIDVLIGVESKVIDREGNLDITDRDYNQAEIVLGSVHRLPVNGGLVHPKELGQEQTLTAEFEHSMAMVKKGLIDVLAHPMGMSVRIYKTFSYSHLDTLIRSIASTDVAFEINAKYTNPEFFAAVMTLCKLHNPFISIGSDVHQLSQLGDSKRMLEGIV